MRRTTAHSWPDFGEWWTLLTPHRCWQWHFSDGIVILSFGVILDHTWAFDSWFNLGAHLVFLPTHEAGEVFPCRLLEDKQGLLSDAPGQRAPRPLLPSWLPKFLAHGWIFI